MQLLCRLLLICYSRIQLHRSPALCDEICILSSKNSRSGFQNSLSRPHAHTLREQESQICVYILNSWSNIASPLSANQQKKKRTKQYNETHFPKNRHLLPLLPYNSSSLSWNLRRRSLASEVISSYSLRLLQFLCRQPECRSGHLRSQGDFNNKHSSFSR